MTLVGLSDDEAFALEGNVFYLYRNDASDNRLTEQTDAGILGLLRISDLSRIKDVKCTIRPVVTPQKKGSKGVHFWPGKEGKVFRIDVHVGMLDGAAQQRHENIFLLKVFSNEDGVVRSDSDGQRRLKRTQYLCEPENNLQLLAKTFPKGANRDLFAGAPILAFSHHLGSSEREKQGEAFVCYIMQDATVSQDMTAANSKTFLERWDVLRSDALLSPHDRIVLAHDLACAVYNLHTRGIQHCDLSPQNVLIIRSADPKCGPRLALIDFDSYSHPDVPALQSHKQHLFSFKDPTDGRDGADSSITTLRRIFNDNRRSLSEDACVKERKGKSYLIRDPLVGRRPVNYLVEAGQGTERHVWLLGAPGHPNYQAPIDLLESDAARTSYDNFALGVLIQDILCWLDTQWESDLITQDDIDRLTLADSPGVRLCGPARFILHKRVLDLLDSVFSGTCKDWPEARKWTDVLSNGPVYRVCPGPMRNVWRRPRQWVGALRNSVANLMSGHSKKDVGTQQPLQPPCLWPLPRLNKSATPNLFNRKARPRDRLAWLERVDPQQQQDLFNGHRLKDQESRTQFFCPACGRSWRF